MQINEIFLKKMVTCVNYLPLFSLKSFSTWLNTSSIIPGINARSIFSAVSEVIHSLVLPLVLCCHLDSGKKNWNEVEYKQIIVRYLWPKIWIWTMNYFQWTTHIPCNEIIMIVFYQQAVNCKELPIQKLIELEIL